MKRLVVFLAVAGLMVAGLSAAQDEGPNSFGMYFDAVGDTPEDYDGCFMMNGGNAGFGESVAAHMVIAGPTSGNVKGFEVQFAPNPAGAVVFTGASFPWNAIDIADTPNAVIVGFADPRFPNACGQVYVGAMNFLVFAADGVFEMLAGPAVPSSIADEAAYLDADGNIIPLEFATDADGMGRGDGPEGPSQPNWTLPGYGLCANNMDAAIPTEEATWSEVKDLFR
jgi:hypothetical protein